MKKITSLLLTLILIVCASITSFAGIAENARLRLKYEGTKDLETGITTGKFYISGYPKEFPGKLHVGKDVYETGQQYDTTMPDIPEYSETNFNPSAFYESTNEKFALKLEREIAEKSMGIRVGRERIYQIIPIICSEHYRIDISPAELTYTGLPQQPKNISVVNTTTGKALINNTDYLLTIKNNTNAGTATITVSGKGDYIGTLSKTFKIIPCDINANNVIWMQANVAYLYDGKPHILPVGATNKTSGINLKKDVDYKVTGENNVNAGTGKTIVTGIGNYKGTKTFGVLIGKAPNSISGGKYTATYHKKLKKNKTFLINAKSTFGTVKYKRLSGNKKITVSSTGKVTMKKGLKPGTYKVKVKMTAPGTSNYNSATRTETIKIIIKKK